MEIVKGLGMAIAICLFTSISSAQDYKASINSFQNSYVNEADGKLSDAILDLKGIYDENSYEINLRLGWLCYSSGLFSESQSYYLKAIQLKPFAIEPRFGIVLPQGAMGNWKAVIDNYDKILEIAPNNSFAMHRLGLIYYGQKDYTKAEKYFEQVVNLFPFDYDGLVMYAWSCFQLKKYREAKVLFNKALMHTPNGVSALEGLSLMN